MGWMDEQFRQRKLNEQHDLEESFLAMAGAVMNDSTRLNMRSSSTRTRDIILQILTHYRLPSPFQEGEEEEENEEDLEKLLENYLQPLGILWRCVKLDKGWYKDATGLMLGFQKEDGAAVVLTPNILGGYSYFGSDGKRHRVNHKNEDMLKEDGLCIYRPFPPQKMGIPGLIRYMMDSVNVTDLAAVGIASLVVALVGLLLPWINGKLFTDVLATKDLVMLMTLGTFMLCVTISKAIFSAVYNMLMARISTKIEINVQSAAMMRVLTMPVSFFRKYNAGELSSRIDALNSLSSMLLSTVLSTVLTSVTSLVFIGQIANFTPKLVLPAVAMLIASLAVSLVTAILEQKSALAKMELDSRELGMSYAMIAGVRKIRIAGAEKRSFARWAKLYAKGINTLPTLVRYSGVINLAITLIGEIVLYSTAVTSHISIGEYQAFNAAYGSVSGAFMALSSIVGTIASLRPALSMALPILDTLPETTKGKQLVTQLNGAIELENVCFRYEETAPWVANHLSVKINPGQYVAIVGKTGCGKSTLVRLMIGFETPQLGSVSFDGKNVNTLNMRSLRKKIGMVNQNGKLLQGDIFSNIVITAPWLTAEDAWQAAEIAGIADDIRAMPMGMRTVLSEGAGGISGGQKQRLLIARAIAPKPQILILDEATSALDNITQRRIARALDELKCTRIVIAHRLSTIRRCDRILVLDKGKFIGDGTFDELMESCPFFRDLVERQQLDE